MSTNLNKLPVPIGTVIYPSDVQVLDFGELKIYTNFDQVPPCEANAAYAVEIHYQAETEWSLTGDFFKSDGTACRNYDRPATARPGNIPRAGGAMRIRCVPLDTVPESIRDWVK